MLSFPLFFVFGIFVCLCDLGRRPPARATVYCFFDLLIGSPPASVSPSFSYDESSSFTNPLILWCRVTIAVEYLLSRDDEKSMGANPHCQL